MGIIDVVSGGFPCQDISTAGKGVGITGERSGLWKEMARIICEVQPRYAFVENSPALTSRGLGTVLGDLVEMGYDAKWGVLGAVDAEAPHKRERIWILGDTISNGRDEIWEDNLKYDWPKPTPNDEYSDYVAYSESNFSRTGLCKEQAQLNRNQFADSSSNIPNTHRERLQEQHASAISGKTRQYPRISDPEWRSAWWSTEPDVGRVVNGVAARVDRLKAIGNGQVPAVVKLAWETLITRKELSG